MFVARFVLAAVFIRAGLIKATHPDDFQVATRNYQLLPPCWLAPHSMRSGDPTRSSFPPPPAVESSSGRRRLSRVAFGALYR
ncbi:MAG: MauE/DoxX family redox-associated membrane protein [Acidimicrobiales bacterium]